jgi:hypothetical protein
VNLFGWNYAFFLPVAVALVLCVLTWRPADFRTNHARAVGIAAVLWILSSAMVLVLFWALAPSRFSRPMVPQRDFGYMIGGALALSLPFIASAMVFYVLTRLGTSSRATQLVAVCAGAAEFLLVPPAFFAGWIFGCAFSGYRSCM